MDAIIESERLVLRGFHVGDASALMGVFGDPEVMRYGDGIQSLKWTEDWIASVKANYQERGMGPLAVIEKESGQFVGYCGLFDLPDVNGRAEHEVGYRLIRSAWGQGYATEAVIAVRDYAFTSLKLDRLIALIDPDNGGSIRVATKAGLRYESDVMLEGYTYADHVYSIEAP